MSTTPNPKPVATHRPIKYVVVRGGHRVSDNEYDLPTDPRCVNEMEFWSRTSHRSSGEKVEAVVYDSKKHQVW